MGKGDRQGTWLGLPYDFGRLTMAKIRRRTWNPDDPRILTPKAYGWGYSVNCYQLLRRLRLIRRS